MFPLAESMTRTSTDNQYKFKHITMSHFDFKKFRIYHDRCAMKVGTDGVLLGAWAEVEKSHNILDIGTGSGLIAIMLAQRTNAQIVGIDLDAQAVEQAKNNAEASPFSQQISISCSDITQYAPNCLYDNIVSNPPYFEESVLPPNTTRANARHTEGLSLENLVKNAKRLMGKDALFQVILPYNVCSKFISLCAVNGLSLLHRTNICTKEGKPFKRSLLRFINNIEATTPTTDMISLSDGNRGRSEEYQKLTEDYYL